MEKLILTKMKNGEDVTKEALELNSDEYNTILGKLYSKGYITKPPIASNVYISLAGCAVTERGLRYVKQN
ncbi:hypothetical protein HRH69_09195 [Enterococcus faecalis]|uniref:hypothetical protein n=1 Tax=Enterococcus faecalis TaxID=1351 RepID=UPI0011423198|nr:hypothetical protein [Enterococcus faecalis]NSW14122.1 hypothetical protein [Enterococcus faecalis]TQB26713.1 hypothetical protein FKZ16_06745 [Enterococcus faecalis]